MDVVEILAGPKDCLKLLKRVASFWTAILVWCQVPTNYAWTCVARRPGWCPNLAEERASSQVSGRVDLPWGLDALKIRVLTSCVIEVWRPAAGVATIAVCLSVDNVATQPD